MQIRVTINEVLFPELTAYLEKVHTGKRSSVIVSLANKACLMTVPPDADHTESKKVVKRRPAKVSLPETEIKSSPVNAVAAEAALPVITREQVPGVPLKRNRMI